MRFIDVLITCPDRAAAEAIARACIEARLAACASIGGEITSIYRWKGAIEHAGEVTLFLKTRAQLFDRLAARAKSLHPYEVPCIVAMELCDLDPAYAKWLEEETEG
jgi:periplasmic divalent cation tolerance protein